MSSLCSLTPCIYIYIYRERERERERESDMKKGDHPIVTVFIIIIQDSSNNKVWNSMDVRYSFDTNSFPPDLNVTQGRLVEKFCIVFFLLIM